MVAWGFQKGVPEGRVFALASVGQLSSLFVSLFLTKGTMSAGYAMLLVTFVHCAIGGGPKQLAVMSETRTPGQQHSKLIRHAAVVATKDLHVLRHLLASGSCVALLGFVLRYRSSEGLVNLLSNWHHISCGAVQGRGPGPKRRPHPRAPCSAAPADWVLRQPDAQ